MTTHPVNFSAVNIATESAHNAIFPSDPRSKRAEAAAKQKFDVNSNSIKDEILFQIVALENISQSKSAQLDELLSLNDLESVGADRLRYSKQRAISNVNVGDNDNNTNFHGTVSTGSSNTFNYFKLTLQDSFGTLVYAVEVEKLPFLSGKNHKSGFPIQLGSKLIVKKGATIVESVILLMRENTEFLGGIVPEWNHKDLNKLHIRFLQTELEKLPKDTPKQKKKK